jgi:hypothetical protein
MNAKEVYSRYREWLRKSMPPIAPNNTRQLSFIIEADEHRMLTELAETNEVSASEWLRKAIREAHQAGGLENLPQRIKRTWDALELEHVDYIRRCKLAYERQAPRPPAKALERRIEETLELIEDRAERKSDMRNCLLAYRSAVGRTLPGVNPPERLEKELQEKYNELWFCIDEWLDDTRAKT